MLRLTTEGDVREVRREVPFASVADCPDFMRVLELDAMDEEGFRAAEGAWESVRLSLGAVGVIESPLIGKSNPPSKLEGGTGFLGARIPARGFCGLHVCSWSLLLVEGANTASLEATEGETPFDTSAGGAADWVEGPFSFAEFMAAASVEA